MSKNGQTRKNKYETDMTQGAILWQIVRFAVPVTLTGLLQLLYNTVDTIVVGQFAGKEALAAVGSTSSLVNLMITLFIGLSVGASITAAKAYGKNDTQRVSDISHTSILLSAICGVFIMVVGFVLTKSLLTAMGVPDDVMDLAVLYLRIFFFSIPFSFINVFGSAILRAVGDAKRPLYILLISGLLNVVLNLLFVIVFNMSVAGVALGTVFSSALSAYLILRVLMRTAGAIRIIPRKLTIKRCVLGEITKIGLPAGLEGATFGISNVLIQSTINSFGSLVVAGSSIAVSLMSFVYVLMQSINQSCITFTSQNMGARQYRRVRLSPLITIAIVAAAGSSVCFLMLHFASPLASLFNSDESVIAYAVLRLQYTFPLYFIFGVMQTFASQLRGMGRSLLPMVISVTGISGIRIAWLYTVFAQSPTFETLLIGYPVSWIVTMLILMVCYLVIIRKLPKGDVPMTQAG